MPREDGFGAVLVYYLIIGVVASGVNLFWTSIFNFSGIGNVFMPDMAASPLSGIVEFLLSPLLLIVTLYLVSGITHLCLMMAGGAKHGFQTTTRVFAFAYSPALLGVIPVVGNIIAFFWMIVLGIIGLREAHETTTGKATFAMLLPTFLFVTLLMIAFMVIAMTGLLRSPL
jgi:hypothetical protein